MPNDAAHPLSRVHRTNRPEEKATKIATSGKGTGALTIRVGPPFQSLTLSAATRLIVDRLTPTIPLARDSTAASIRAGHHLPSLSAVPSLRWST